MCTCSSLSNSCHLPIFVPRTARAKIAGAHNEYEYSEEHKQNKASDDLILQDARTFITVILITTSALKAPEPRFSFACATVFKFVPGITQQQYNTDVTTDDLRPSIINGI
mmetsp:Transcript_37531/g.72717  ORF Transcript_37531/g.72717 Transcript_37531/m.72717 type:complete len:110 (+) Transcript_37531:167-496(+)